ncbi:MAG: carbohydrate kinase family protein [Paludibacteraceae bacterium]|nr:carbohydrate kinase family protein [Paludibacteraceae bacterium]
MVTVIGATNIDIIAATSSAFVAHDSNPSHITMGIGGVGKNYAHNLVLLGESIQFISLFGDDYFGEVARKECKRLGFGLHLSHTPKGSRSSMFLCINNTLGQMQAGAADVEIIEQYLTPEFLDARKEDINNSQLVLFDANLPVATMVWLLENCTAPMMADTVSRKKASRITEALKQAHNPHLHTLKLNRIEAQYILGEEAGKDFPSLCKQIHELGVSNIYITLGAEGVFCSGTPFQLELVNPTQVSFPPIQPKQVVDTNGAGDAFLSGVAYAFLQGVDFPITAKYGLQASRATIEVPSVVNPNLKEELGTLYNPTKIITTTDNEQIPITIA